MRRLLLVAFFTAFASAASAQTPTAAPADDAAQVMTRLSAIWRPLAANPTGTPDEIFATACEGAVAELDELAAAFPAEITPEAVADLRSTRGLVIAPGSEPGQVFVFPNPMLSGMAGGLGGFTVINRAQGRIDLRDAAGTVTQVQLGAAGGRALLRLLRPNAGPLTFVGCASTAE